LQWGENGNSNSLTTNAYQRALHLTQTFVRVMFKAKRAARLPLRRRVDLAGLGRSQSELVTPVFRPGEKALHL
jgi:hypothetical protein